MVSDHDDVCPLASPMLVAMSEHLYGPGNFWSGNHPTQQGTWVVSEADCSTISYDQCVVLFMRLVDWDRREHVLRLPYSEVVSPTFPGYTSFGVLPCPSGEQGMEPWHQFRQGSKVHRE